ncbi:Imm50 family immunity protein [Hymenobacter convexus]|uniref:Imm50 family immunity protein n=1 Tax=Hymenobacter sp. CA1UV-4 TaxID=3063782 RepID=UPI002712EEE0|nr:Imm50 family immunity protein [Hymenobacter sp. CA1UV-4]MDO7854252.1 Imm50 family immunity protein [Hymenobacter sp. CA1UV-4]
MSESEDPVISRIVNSEIVIQHFGYWPSFHDAEVTKTTFETHPTGRYSVTFIIAAFEMTSEVDERGYYKLIKHCDVELQFIGIDKMEFNDFSFQNVLFGLEFEEVGRNIKCSFDASVGLEAVIAAEEVFVLSLTPTEPEPDEPLIDIESADMSDAANIVIASRDLTRTFDWSEWIYIGLNNESDNDYQTQKVAELAHNFFEDEKVYLIIGYGEGSHLTTLSESLTQMSALLKTNEVLICNTSFTKAMKFNMIGVMSYGQKHN